MNADWLIVLEDQIRVLARLVLGQKGLCRRTSMKTQFVSTNKQTARVGNSRTPFEDLSNYFVDGSHLFSLAAD